MDAENPDKKTLKFVSGEPKSGKTEKVLTQAFNYARHGWLVLFISCDMSLGALYKKIETLKTPVSDGITFKFVEKRVGYIREVIQLCEQKHPDILVLDGAQPSVNDLRILNQSVKDLNMLAIVTRRPVRPDDRLN